MKAKTIGVLGLGIFGSTVCKTLSEFDCDIIAIDLDIKNIQRVEQFVTQGAQADISDLEQLRSLGIENCDTVIIATGSNLEASTLAILHCIELGVTNIVAKAKNKTYAHIFEKLGATKTIRPEKEMGERVARELMRNNVIDVIDLDEEYSVVEFYTPKTWVNHTILQLNVRAKYGINIIGIRKDLQSKMNVNFGPDYVFSEHEIVVAIAESTEFENLDLENKL